MGARWCRAYALCALRGGPYEGSKAFCELPTMLSTEHQTASRDTVWFHPCSDLPSCALACRALIHRLQLPFATLELVCRARRLALCLLGWVWTAITAYEADAQPWVAFLHGPFAPRPRAKALTGDGPLSQAYNGLPCIGKVGTGSSRPRRQSRPCKATSFLMYPTGNK